MAKFWKKILIALSCAALSALLIVGVSGCSKTIPQWIREQQCGAHEWNEGEVTKEATCTEEGETLFTCTTCGATETQVRAMIPHNEHEVAEVPSTCTEIGYTDGVQCVDCGTWIVGHDVIPMKEHNIVVQEGREATCLTKGITEGSYCETCETVFAEQMLIPALGHSIVVKAGFAATCTVDGKTQGQECTRCGKVYLEQETIPATGHSLKKLEGYAATCLESGLTDGEKCTKCGKFTVEQEVIAATGHEIAKLEGYAATCTSNGLTDGERCTTCGETLKVQTEIPLLGHSTKVLPAVAATCLESGLTSGESCLRCGLTLKAQEVIAATGHTVVAVEGYAATCTEAGLTDGEKCSVCDLVITPQQEIEPAHTVVVDEAVAATCRTDGLTEGSHCSACNTVITEQEVINAFNHEGYIVYSGGKPATCTENGLTDNVTCSLCGELLMGSEFIPANGHSFENGVCTSCGLSRDESLYDFVESGNYTLAEVEVGETVVGNWYRIYDTRTYDEDGVLSAAGYLEFGNLHIAGSDFSDCGIPFTHIGCDSHGGYYTVEAEKSLTVSTWLWTQRGEDENGYYTDVYIDSATITSLTSAGLPCSHTIDSTTTVSAVYTYSNGGDDAPIMVYRLAPIAA